MSVLEIRNVSYVYQSKYQTTEALKNVSVSFEKGSVYAVTGKSGSGKTTLLSLMAGLDLPSEGEILCEGVSTKEMDLQKYRRTKAAVIYQSFRLLPLLTVAENIMFPMELSGKNRKEAGKEALELMKRVSLPSSYATRFPSMLSRGEQQRAAIARALAMNTDLLLADEPTGNLDSANSRNIMEILTKLAHEEGYCVIIVTHDPAIANASDHVIRMNDGKIDNETESA